MSNRDHTLPLLVALSVTVVLFVVVAVVMSSRETETWEAFKVEHACRVVGKTSRSTGVTVNPSAPSGTNPVSVVVISGKTGWLCDDGVTYWR